MEIYTAVEVAEKLKANVMVIRRKIKKGEIKGCKQKGEWLVTEKNFLEYTHGIEHPILASEFAKIVRKRASTICLKIISGEIRGVKLGKWYVDFDEIVKFIGE